MKSWTVALILLPLVLIACDSVETTRETLSTESKGNGTFAKQDVWTCPMHPQVRKSGPGKCPICGMDLVKAADGASASLRGAPSGHSNFHLVDDRQQMIGVRRGKVERRALFKEIEVAGRVAFDPELYTAQTEYVEALRQLESVRGSPIAEVRHSSERMVESAKLRLKILGLSDKQIAALRSSGTSGSNLLIPKPGETIWIYAEVFEMDLPYVLPGLEARVSGGSLGEQALIGKVVSVDRVINPETRTARVRIQLPSLQGILRPESFVHVTLLSPLGQQIVVPFGAILDTGKEAWAFVVDQRGEFTPRQVRIRLYAGDWVAIESGLKEGEEIVLSANFLIDSESRLQAARQADLGSTTPSCPQGEVWHPEMKHCMKKAGNGQ